MPNTVKLVEIDHVREKLVDDVHSKLMGLLQRTPYIRCEDVHRQYAVNWLMNNGVTVQEWISVKDRLPEHKGNYLGFTGSTTMVGYYKGNGIWWIWLNDTEGKNIFTHWIPLPPVPEEE